MDTVESVVIDSPPSEKTFDLTELEGVGTVRRNRLVEAGVNTPQEVVLRGPQGIAEITNMEYDQAEKIVKAARMFLQESHWMAQSIKTAKQELEERKALVDANRMSTGSKALDTLLRGGVEPRAVTEFYGQYSSGKTQICHTLSVIAQLPKDKGGLEGRVIYIDTEGTFRPERIREIIIERGLVNLKERERKSDPKEPVNEEDITKFMENIIHMRAFDSSEQMLMVNEKLPELLNEKDKAKTVLIIVDSITNHFRWEYIGRGLLQNKQSLLNKHIHRLERIAEMYNIAVVITNQVISDPGGFTMPIKPAGGNVLAHTSTYRIFLRRSGQKRVARMDDSPMHATSEVVFTADGSGIVDVGDVQDE